MRFKFEALGSKYKKKYLGTFGDCGCFSFSAAKTLSTGQGGMIVTDNKRIKDKLFELKKIREGLQEGQEEKMNTQV